jgi:hypothetical protein
MKQLDLLHTASQSDGTERYLVTVNGHTFTVKLTPSFRTSGSYWPTISDGLQGILVELPDSPNFIDALSSAIREAAFITDTQYAGTCPA